MVSEMPCLGAGRPDAGVAQWTSYSSEMALYTSNEVQGPGWGMYGGVDTLAPPPSACGTVCEVRVVYGVVMAYSGYGV